MKKRISEKLTLPAIDKAVTQAMTFAIRPLEDGVTKLYAYTPTAQGWPKGRMLDRFAIYLAQCL